LEPDLQQRVRVLVLMWEPTSADCGAAMAEPVAAEPLEPVVSIRRHRPC